MSPLNYPLRDIGEWLGSCSSDHAGLTHSFFRVRVESLLNIFLLVMGSPYSSAHQSRMRGTQLTYFNTMSRISYGRLILS